MPSFMPEITMSVEGIEDTVRDFKRWVKEIGARSESITRLYGARLQADIRARARRQFDVTDYDQSIWLRMTGGGIRPTARVGSSDPQAHRLEYGFIGVDRLGRYVEQPPRPHFRPALDRIRGQYVRAISDLVR